MMRCVGAMAAIAAFLAGCAGPLTTAKTGMNQCKAFLRRAEGGFLERSTAPAPGVNVNMLILSGGGKFGAYGAGFLQGWSKAESMGTLGSGDMRRNSITIVTAISTGALQATAATIGNAMADPDARLAGPDSDLVNDYKVDNAAIGKARGLITSLSSNGLRDISKGLKPLVQRVTARYWTAMQALPAGFHTYIGMVNLDDGNFYIADLVEVAKSGAPNAQDCYNEFILASAAVPVEFAPRYIDGSPYVDGGVRFGTFLGDYFAGAAARSMRSSSGTSAKVNFRAIINGTLSANDPAADPKRAARCDASTLETILTECPPSKNSLLAIASRSAGQILVDQIYRDSARRLDLELERQGIRGSTGFVYIPNTTIAAQCEAAKTSGFDPSFMACLTQIGLADGAAQNWLSVDALPRAGKSTNPTR